MSNDIDIDDIRRATIEYYDRRPVLRDDWENPHATDPTDDDGMRTLEPMVMVDLRLPSRTLQRAGGRVRVRFDHGTKPLATQLYRRLTQVFLQMFNPVS